MKHAGFTPGPWRWMQRGDFSILERGEEPSFPILKIANGGLLPIGPDARLIADAPRFAEENERLKKALERLRLESLLYLENTSREPHLRIAINDAWSALAAPKG